MAWLGWASLIVAILSLLALVISYVITDKKKHTPELKIIAANFISRPMFNKDGAIVRTETGIQVTVKNTSNEATAYDSVIQFINDPGPGTSRQVKLGYFEKFKPIVRHTLSPGGEYEDGWLPQAPPNAEEAYRKGKEYIADIFIVWMNDKNKNKKFRLAARYKSAVCEESGKLRFDSVFSYTSISNPHQVKRIFEENKKDLPKEFF